MGDLRMSGRIAGGVIAAAMVGVSPAWFPVRAAAADRSDDEVSALVACQTAIEAVLADADRVRNTDNRGEGDRFVFEWTGSIQARNAFGARVKASALCAGSWAACDIDLLMIDGKMITAVSAKQPLKYQCPRG